MYILHSRSNYYIGFKSMKHKVKNEIHEKMKLCFVSTFIIAYINDVKFKYKNIMQQLY